MRTLPTVQSVRMEPEMEAEAAALLGPGSSADGGGLATLGGERLAAAVEEHNEAQTPCPLLRPTGLRAEATLFEPSVATSARWALRRILHGFPRPARPPQLCSKAAAGFDILCDELRKTIRTAPADVGATPAAPAACALPAPAAAAPPAEPAAVPAGGKRSKAAKEARAAERREAEREREEQRQRRIREEARSAQEAAFYSAMHLQ